MKTAKDFTVGQNLWFQPFDTRWDSGKEVKVTKIGRAWVHTTGGYRFNPESMIANGEGFSSPGRFYQSKDAYEEHAAAGALHRQLYSKMIRGHLPIEITTADVRTAASHLRIELEES